MRSTHNSRTLRITAATVALLVVIPAICGARCTSHLCIPAVRQAATEDCHHTAGNSPDGFAVSSQPEPCAASEMFLVVPRINSELSAHSTQFAATPAAPALDPAPLSTTAAFETTFDTSPPESSPSSVLPLRI